MVERVEPDGHGGEETIAPDGAKRGLSLDIVSLDIVCIQLAWARNVEIHQACRL